MSPRVAFVTGAGGGVGRAIVRRLARDGYSVAAVGRTEARLASIVEELLALGVNAMALLCDVTNRDAVFRAARHAEDSLGQIDVLVNNAGAAGSAAFVNMDDSLWERMLAVNLTGTYFCMRAMLPGMLERRCGRVINIASIAGKTGFPYTAAYCAAKHAVVGLTRAVALETAPKGVTVNAVCPGWLNTEMTEQSIARIARKTGRTPDEARTVLEQMNPQGRLIEPEEVADVVAFLASAAAQAINGQALNVDGGELLL